MPDLRCKIRGRKNKEIDESTHEDHEDRIAGNGINLLHHHNLVHKFFLCLIKVPDGKNSSGEIMSKSRENSGMWILIKICSNLGFFLELWKIFQEGSVSVKVDANIISSRSHDMKGHAEKCVERYCEVANKTIQELYNVATSYLDDHLFREEEIGAVGELFTVCSQIVL